MASKPVQIDIKPKDIKRAENLWNGFMATSKFVTIAICAILLMMAFAFIG